MCTCFPVDLKMRRLEQDVSSAGIIFSIKNRVLRDTLILHIKKLSEGIIWYSWSEKNRRFPLNTLLRGWHLVMQNLWCSSFISHHSVLMLQSYRCSNQWHSFFPLKLKVRTNLKRGKHGLLRNWNFKKYLQNDASRDSAGHLGLRGDCLWH